MSCLVIASSGLWHMQVHTTVTETAGLVRSTDDTIHYKK
jgi:hypothetical protein